MGRGKRFSTSWEQFELNWTKRDGFGLVRTDGVRVPLAATMVAARYVPQHSRSQIAGPEEGARAIVA